MSWDDLSRSDLFELAAAYGDTENRNEVATAVERTGHWEDKYEWRISTYGTEWMERIPGGFRAGADFNGRFRVDLATFDEAWEALRVLQRLGTSLFYALSWTERRSTPGLETEPDRPAAEAYLKRLARETAELPPTADERRTLSVVTAPPPAYWDDSPEHIYVVTVRDRSLVLECDCAMPERARLFLGVFDALVTDLLEILGWEPLE